MATDYASRHRMVEITPTEATLGASPGRVSSSSTARLQKMFPASPIHSGQLKDAERAEYYQSNVISAVVSDGGHTFGEVGTDYINAPNMAEVDLTKHNLPSPYVPNPASPGPGSQNDADKPKPPADFGKNPSSTFGTGEGSRLSPNESSKNIAGQLLRKYELGKSSLNKQPG